jgi:flagellar biosynthesis protein FliQ
MLPEPISTIAYLTLCGLALVLAVMALSAGLVAGLLLVIFRAMRAMRRMR